MKEAVSYPLHREIWELLVLKVLSYPKAWVKFNIGKLYRMCTEVHSSWEGNSSNEKKVLWKGKK